MQEFLFQFEQQEAKITNVEPTWCRKATQKEMLFYLNCTLKNLEGFGESEGFFKVGHDDREDVVVDWEPKKVCKSHLEWAFWVDADQYWCWWRNKMGFAAFQEDSGNVVATREV